MGFNSESGDHVPEFLERAHFHSGAGRFVDSDLLAAERGFCSDGTLVLFVNLSSGEVGSRMILSQEHWRRRSDSNRRITVCKRLTEPAAWQWIKGSAILFHPLGQGQQRGPGRRARGSRARGSGSVIRFSALDGVGSVELLKQDHEGQLMLHRHGRERPYFVATIT